MIAAAAGGDRFALEQLADIPDLPAAIKHAIALTLLAGDAGEGFQQAAHIYDPRNFPGDDLRPVSEGGTRDIGGVAREIAPYVYSNIPQERVSLAAADDAAATQPNLKNRPKLSPL